MAAHLLHIGKTGGTALKAALHRATDATETTTALGILHVHGHDMTLDRLPEGDVAVCFLRDPVTRFVSAFDSRYRRGRPRYNRRWSIAETIAFTMFPTAASLAEALADDRSAAKFAMRSIQHLNRHYTHWLGPVDASATRRERLAFVGRQETLTDDVERLRRLLHLSQPLELPDDPVAADRKSTRLNSSHMVQSRMPSSA